jgi:hypothetical protein
VVAVLSFMLVVFGAFDMDAISIAVIVHICFCFQSCVKGFVL